MITSLTVTAAKIEKECTCGALDFATCFCNLTYNEWLASVKRQGKNYNPGVGKRGAAEHMSKYTDVQLKSMVVMRGGRRDEKEAAHAELKRRKGKTARKGRANSDICKYCGSPNLWDNFFDADGYGVPDDSKPGWKWRTLCQDCGEMQS